MKKVKILSGIALLASPIACVTVTTSCNKSQSKGEITNVEITTNQSSLKLGKTLQFEAKVHGTGSFSEDVKWIIVKEAGSDLGCTMTESGLLTAGSTSGDICIEAISKQNDKKFAQKWIEITNKTPIVAEITNGKYVGPISSETTGFNASINPDDGHDFPSSITINLSSSNYTYNSTNGSIKVTNVPENIDTIKISATCPVKEPKLIVENNKQNIPSEAGTKGEYVTSCTSSQIKLNTKLVISYTITSGKKLLYDKYSTIQIGSKVYYLDSDLVTHDATAHTITIDAQLMKSTSVTVQLNAGNAVAMTALSVYTDTDIEVGYKSKIIVDITPAYATDRNYSLSVATIAGGSLDPNEYLILNAQEKTISGIQPTGEATEQFEVIATGTVTGKRAVNTIAHVTSRTSITDPTYEIDEEGTKIQKFTTKSFDTQQDAYYELVFNLSKCSKDSYASKQWEIDLGAACKNVSILVNDEKTYLDRDYKVTSDKYEFTAFRANQLTKTSTIKIRFKSSVDKTAVTFVMQSSIL